MSKSNEMLLKLDGFQYATLLYLNMGCYHIRLSKRKINLFTIILLWGKYSYKRIPMGVDNSPDIFQQKMNDLSHGFESICAYIDELFILTRVYWTDYVNNIELTINKPKEIGMICNIEK